MTSAGAKSLPNLRSVAYSRFAFYLLVPSNNVDNYFSGYWQDMPPILKKNVNQSTHDLDVASSNLRLWLGNSKLKQLALDFYLKYAKIKIARRYYE